MTNGRLPRTMVMREARADLLAPPHLNSCFASADISVRSSRFFFVTIKINIYRIKVSHTDLIYFEEKITRWRLGNLHSWANPLEKCKDRKLLQLTIPFCAMVVYFAEKITTSKMAAWQSPLLNQPPRKGQGLQTPSRELVRRRACLRNWTFPDGLCSHPSRTSPEQQQRYVGTSDFVFNTKLNIFERLGSYVWSFCNTTASTWPLASPSASSVAVLAETSLRSPQKILFFYPKIYLSDLSIQKNTLI